MPIEVRRLLGVRAGAGCYLRATAAACTPAPCATKAHSKNLGIGTPGIGSGRKAINRWLRELRGKTRGE